MTTEKYKKQPVNHDVTVMLLRRLVLTGSSHKLLTSDDFHYKETNEELFKTELPYLSDSSSSQDLDEH
jgi:hypothetical protein